MLHVVRRMHPQASYLLFLGEDTDYASHAKLLLSVFHRKFNACFSRCILNSVWQLSYDIYFMIIICPRWMHNDLQVALVGTKVDLTYSYEVRYLSIVLCLVALDSFRCIYIFVVYNFIIFIFFSILVIQLTAWKRLFLETMRFQRWCKHKYSIILQPSIV